MDNNVLHFDIAADNGTSLNGHIRVQLRPVIKSRGKEIRNITYCSNVVKNCQPGLLGVKKVTNGTYLIQQPSGKVRIATPTSRSHSIWIAIGRAATEGDYDCQVHYSSTDGGLVTSTNCAWSNATKITNQMLVVYVPPEYLTALFISLYIVEPLYNDTTCDFIEPDVLATDVIRKSSSGIFKSATVDSLPYN